MSREHFPSLRDQLIDALVQDGSAFSHRSNAEAFFDARLWPVLDKAMEAGELLVARNTKPQKPVHEAVTFWLHEVVSTIERLRGIQHTVSKRGLLDALFYLQKSAQTALADAGSVQSPADKVSSIVKGLG